MVVVPSLRNAVLCISCVALARAQTIRSIGDMTLQSYDLGRHRIPSWSSEALVVIDNDRTVSPIVRLFDREGRESQPFAISVPGANTVGLRSVAHGPDGMLVFVGFAIDEDSGNDKARVADFLGIVSADRSKQVVVRTNPYVPRAVVIAPDKTIWTAGQEKTDDAKRDPGAVRHYDTQGKEIGSFIPQSSVHVGASKLEDNLAFGDGHLGWYPAFGTVYFEIFPDGVVRQFPALSSSGAYQFITKLAITNSGLTFISNWAVIGNARISVETSCSRATHSTTPF